MSEDHELAILRSGKKHGDTNLDNFVLYDRSTLIEGEEGRCLDDVVVGMNIKRGPLVLKGSDASPALKVPRHKLQVDTSEGPNVVGWPDEGVGIVNFRGAVRVRVPNAFPRRCIIPRELGNSKVSNLQQARPMLGFQVSGAIGEPEDVWGLDIAVQTKQHLGPSLVLTHRT